MNEVPLQYFDNSPLQCENFTGREDLKILVLGVVPPAVVAWGIRDKKR